MTRIIGYTRELVAGEGTSADIEQLERAGAETVFADPVATRSRTRPRLAACLRYLEVGDVLVVVSSDHLSTTRTHFVSTTAELTSRGISVWSLSEPALSEGTDESADPVQVVAALDALSGRLDARSRLLRSVGTREGLAVASAEGRRAGRRPALTEDLIAVARELQNIGRSYDHIGRVLGVSPTTVQRALTRTNDSSERTA